LLRGSALQHAVRQRGRQALKKACIEASKYRSRLTGKAVVLQ
jgi:hypothetical protein